jgi:hypothetical protein
MTLQLQGNSQAQGPQASQTWISLPMQLSNRTLLIQDLIKGRKIINFSILEHGFCSMPLSDGYSISIETLCRFVGLNGEFIASNDQGHLFGLSAPFDASVEMSKAIKGKTIQKVLFSKDTGDLVLALDCGRFEIVCSSAGYECYQLNGPDGFIVVVLGGRQ